MSWRAVLLWCVAAFYAYGALVHVANMLSLTGYDWSDAPAKWQILDIVYLALDICVAVGLGLRWRASIAAFYVAALSQIALYTIGRAWVLDVPDAFRPPPDAAGYLDGLVAFHVVSLGAVTVALWWRRGLSA